MKMFITAVSGMILMIGMMVSGCGSKAEEKAGTTTDTKQQAVEKKMSDHDSHDGHDHDEHEGHDHDSHDGHDH